MSHFLEGTAELGQAFSDGIPPDMIPGELRFRDPEKREAGAAPPPECDGEKGPAHGFCGIGKTEPVGIEGHHYIQHKKAPTSEVTHCVSQAGDGIHRFFIGQGRQERIIEDVGSGKTDGSQGIDQHSHQPVSLLHQEKTGGHQHPEVGEQGHETLLVGSTVGDGSQNRSHQGDQQTGYRVGQTKLGGAHVDISP